MTSTDPDHAAKVAALQKRLVDLKRRETELIVQLHRNRWDQSSAMHGLIELGATEDGAG